MQNFFARPTPKMIADYIYNQVIHVHETGGKTYRYPISQTLSISFVNDVIDRLCEYIHDADIIQLLNGYIVIDWS
jgi:hypothetical protein